MNYSVSIVRKYIKDIPETPFGLSEKRNRQIKNTHVFNACFPEMGKLALVSYADRQV